MRKFINKILKLLNFSGREWILLLLALLLASGVWLIHKLSQEYSVYLSVDVVAQSNIEERSAYSTSAVEIMARCRTSGWRILYSYLTRDQEVVVKFPSSLMNHEGEDKYSISTERLHEYADNIFGSNVSVEYFVADKVYFQFQKEVCKKVPIKPVSSLSFEDQYLPNSELWISPDSVLVYGDELHLESVEYVTTETIRQSSINENLNGMISLTPINGMRYSVDEVHYKMDVARYVEIENLKVPVEIINVPPGKYMVSDPLYVDVMLECEFPLKSNPNKGLYLVADYNDFKNSLGGYAVVNPYTLPLGTINYKISPSFVSVKEEDR